MTSGNLSEEPICMTNEEVRDRLKNLADFFLLHNRDIHIRCDDSVATVLDEKEVLIRRSRGFAPHPIYLKIDSPGILACGAELKNTFCLSKDNACFISQHMGDLQNLEAYNFFCETITHYQKFFRIEPVVIAYDLHPDYLATKYAFDRSHQSAIQLVGIQHHHAHLASCMADNNLSDKVIGVIFDGTGYGLDGKVWGGEFLVGDYTGFQRVGHLRYVPLPGGDTAIENPYRMTLAYLFSIFGRKCLELDIPFIARLDHKAVDIIFRQLETGINSSLTSSCGRLFDAVSSLLGLRDKITYEGQAAIELEMLAAEGVEQFYHGHLKEEDEQIIVDTGKIFPAIIQDLKNGTAHSIIAAKFHNTVAHFIGEVCRRIRDKTSLNKVVLSGGVFQNGYLLLKARELLGKSGFEPYFHKQIPTNDGGISMGQSVIAASQTNLS